LLPPRPPVIGNSRHEAGLVISIPTEGCRYINP
jgi:hypothetical protein